MERNEINHCTYIPKRRGGPCIYCHKGYGETLGICSVSKPKNQAKENEMNDIPDDIPVNCDVGDYKEENEMNDMPTPRTNAESAAFDHACGRATHAVSVQLARTLERSLNDFCSALGFTVTSEDNAESARNKMEAALRKAHNLLR